jgi:hypothetical protein
VLDVNGRQLLVYRDPGPDPTPLHGHSYFTQRVLGPADAIAPLAVPNQTVNVADLLP